jgi:hypothetical protein
LLDGKTLRVPSGLVGRFGDAGPSVPRGLADFRQRGTSTRTGVFRPVRAARKTADTRGTIHFDAVGVGEHRLCAASEGTPSVASTFDRMSIRLADRYLRVSRGIREMMMIKLIGILVLSVGMAGCVAAQPYDDGSGYYAPRTGVGVGIGGGSFGGGGFGGGGVGVGVGF